jgi:hypothetical protein
VRRATAAPSPSSTRTALQQRLAGILARTASPNPVADDEARRLGERPSDRELLKSDPDLTLERALANLCAGLPVKDVTTRLRTDDGRFLDPATGMVTDTVLG